MALKAFGEKAFEAKICYLIELMAETSNKLENRSLNGIRDRLDPLLNVVLI